jgi:hypothetical protein
MTNTSLWPITVDGVRLDSYAWNIRARAGRDYAAPLKTTNIDSPMEDGEVWVPGKKYGPGSLILQMWVGGCDSAGAIPADRDMYYVYRKNLDALRRLFSKQYALLDVQQIIRISTGEIRQADCQLVLMADPEMVVPTVYTAQFGVELSLPGAFWRSVADANWDSATGITAGAVQQLTPFADITAPMKDVYLVLDGPATNPKWTDQPSGHFIQLNRALLSTEQWVVNTTTGGSRIGLKTVPIEFTELGTSVASQTVYGGYLLPKMFGVTPLTPNPRLVVDFTSGSAATRARIRGRLKYL